MQHSIFLHHSLQCSMQGWIYGRGLIGGTTPQTKILIKKVFDAVNTYLKKLLPPPKEGGLDPSLI